MPDGFKDMSMIGSPTLWHLCGWIERIPGETRQTDGLETGIMRGCGREKSVGTHMPRTGAFSPARAVG